MLKANEKKSQETLAKVTKLVNEASNGKTYSCLYAYQEKNLILFKLITHYAIGFNNDEVIAIPMSSDGEKIKEPMRFKVGSETKITLYKLISLANETKKIKVQVPGIVPDTMGIKQLQISQVENTSAFFELLKACS